MTQTFRKHYLWAIWEAKLGSVGHSLASCQSEFLKKVRRSWHLQCFLNSHDHGARLLLPPPWRLLPLQGTYCEHIFQVKFLLEGLKKLVKFKELLRALGIKHRPWWGGGSWKVLGVQTEHGCTPSLRELSLQGLLAFEEPRGWCPLELPVYLSVCRSL